jgi:hypothetical protein
MEVKMKKARKNAGQIVEAVPRHDES